MKKLTWHELNELINKHNRENNIKYQFSDKKPLKCVVVYKQENWEENYTLIERSYCFRSDNKYFISNLIGNSIYGDCLDNEDIGVRLDYYNWKIDYCYIVED